MLHYLKRGILDEQLHDFRSGCVTLWEVYVSWRGCIIPREVALIKIWRREMLYYVGKVSWLHDKRLWTPFLKKNERFEWFIQLRQATPEPAVPLLMFILILLHTYILNNANCSQGASLSYASVRERCFWVSNQPRWETKPNLFFLNLYIHQNLGFYPLTLIFRCASISWFQVVSQSVSQQFTFFFRFSDDNQW